MSTIEPGWYTDPADPSTQRYWDGDGWIGEPLPADATPPAGPPPPVAATPEPVSEPAVPTPVAAPGRPAKAAPPLVVPPGYIAVRVEPRPHGLMLAGAGSRFVARMIDILIVLALCVVANFWFAVQLWQDIQPYAAGVWAMAEAGQTNVESLPVPPDSANGLLILMSAVVTAVWFAYEVPASANTGQTLGKRLLGIKVVRLESEDRLGFGRSLRRWSWFGLPTLFWAMCCGIPLLFQLIDCLFVAIDRPLRQARHDRFGGTVVIQVPRPGRPETAQLKPVTETVTTGGRNADPR